MEGVTSSPQPGQVYFEAPDPGQVDLKFAGSDVRDTAAWAIPGMVIVVSALILVVSFGSQLMSGFGWLPIARRSLGSFGLGGIRRRSRGRE